MNTINENIIQKVNYGLFLVLVFSLSVFHKWVPILIILWGLSWFFDGGINRLRVSIRNRNNFILLSIFFLFFLLHIIGLFYTSPDNLNRGLASIEKNIYLLIIPLFILSANKYYQKEQVFVSFILGCFISFLWILFIAFKNSGEEETLLNNIKNVVFYHHTYLSLYFNMAILFVIWIIHQVSKKQYYIYIIAGLLIVFFSLANYYLSSRIGIIVNILILIGWFSYSLFQFRYGKILLPVIFVIFYLSIDKLTQINYDFGYTKRAITNIIEGDKSYYESTKVRRLKIWYAASRIIKENIVFGVGTGDDKETFKKQYKIQGDNYLSRHSLNAHNQFFQTIVQLGIIGVLPLMLLFFVFPIILYRVNNKLLCFTIVVLLFFMVEAILCRVAGVVFFSVFYSFIYSDDS